MAGQEQYNQFAPQKIPAGDQKTNFIITDYPDNVPDEFAFSKQKSMQTKDGWEVWQGMRQPI